LLADIGGTNASFARLNPDGEVVARRVYRVADFADFDAALGAYFADTGGLEGCGSAAVGAAGPVLDGEARLTNAPWRIGEARISQLAGGVPARLVNDLEAVALSLPHLKDTDLKPLGEVREVASRRRGMLALNVGTGFGAAVTFPVNGSWAVCPSEAGHMSFAARDEAERARFAKRGSLAVTVEDALSGRGLVSLYESECRRLGSEASAATAEEVFARVPLDAAAKQALAVFTQWLGRVARDLALATAAWGGVFLTGGVVQGWSALASAGLFRASFEAGGKMQDRVRRIATAVIVRQDAAFLGLAHVRVG
jgi:glucokinase